MKLIALFWSLSFAALAMAAVGCTNNCVASPGVCPPNPSCIDGYRRTGSASCENGTWVCGRVACVADAGACDGPCPDGSDSPTSNGTPCGDTAFFTACVHQCGEMLDSEPMPAQCVQGTFKCEASLTPASDCPSGSWTSERLPCGPWPGTYDCGFGCAVCTDTRLWTCGACPDGGGAD